VNTIILLVDSSSEWLPESWALEHGGNLCPEGQIVIEQDFEWLSIVRDDHVLNEFDQDERDRLETIVHKPSAHIIEWIGDALVVDFLLSIPPKTRAAIDNDHGLLIDAHEVSSKPLETWVRRKCL